MSASWSAPWHLSTLSLQPRRSRRRLLLGVLALLLLLATARIGYVLGQQWGIGAMRAESNHRLDLFASSVVGIVKRLDHMPATVQLNEDVLGLLRDPHNPSWVRSVNTYLRRLNAHIASIAVFVLDERGIVLASSNNGREGDSAIGEDMSFRPYFLDALSGRVGRHFAIGVKGNQPGYFVSHPIRDGARVVGVTAIQISLEPIDRIWEMLGGPAMLVDSNQVVIMSSQPQWRYTALTELPLETRVDLQLNRMYNNMPIRRFGLPVDLSAPEDGQVFDGRLPDGAPPADRSSSAVTLVLSRVLDGMDWRLVTFSDMRGVRRQALAWAMMFAVATGFCMLLALYVAQRRRISRQKLEARRILEKVNVELEQKVVERMRDLTEVNDRLRMEMKEREEAEQRLRTAQNELLHAAKMTVLGKLATSITHELMQPLGAIRTLSGNAIEFLKRSEPDEVLDNLLRVARLADQMGRIVQPLKAFARKSVPLLSACDVAHVVGNALFLYEMRVRNEHVQVINRCVRGQAIAWCDPNRLEQVLINLVGNAIDSMGQAASRVLTLETHALDSYAPADGPDGEPGGPGQPCSEHGWIRIDVLDTGGGLPETVRGQLFEPFFTTKSTGAGLGLGLAISREIVREFQGAIEAHNRSEGGARFSVFLPAAPEGATAPPALLEFSVNPS